MDENQDRKQRITDVVKRMIEETVPHLRDDGETIRRLTEACEKWDDNFLSTVEKFLEKGTQCLN